MFEKYSNSSEISAILELFDQLDSNKNGYIEYSEFSNACINIQSLLNDKNLKEAFKAIDSDSDGKVSLNEMKGFFKYSVHLNKFCESVFSKADSNNDNYVQD